MPTADADLPGFEALYDEAACGLVFTTQDGTIKRANRTFCRWLGYDGSDLTDGRRIQDLLSMGGRIFHQTHWAPLLQIQGSIAEVKLELVHREKHSISMLLNAVRRQYPQGIFHELAFVIARDRNRFEQELVRARAHAEGLLAKQIEVEKALNASQAQLEVAMGEAHDRALFAEQMIGIVSHDLRNPLAVIKMATELLARSEDDPKKLKTLAYLSQSTLRAQRLVADLLDFTIARIGRGLNVVKVPIELHRIGFESVAELKMAFPGRQLLHRQHGDGECLGDADRLTQLIGNLVANAVSYGATDHDITVVTRIAPETYSIAVHNSGAPIPAETISRLFEPMTRGDAKDGLGVGLGLFIVKEITKAHGGEVSVQSRPAEGTTFLARFPR